MSGVTGAAAAVGAGTALYGTLNQPDAQTVSTSTQIPDHLEEFFQQGAFSASRGLGNLHRLLSGGGGGATAADLVAPFNQDQLQAMQVARARALGAGGFIPTAQQQLLQTAQGQPISSFLPESAFSALSGAARGRQLPPAVMEAFQSLTGASTRALTQTAQGDFLFGGEGFQAAVDAAVRSAQPHIFSRFGGAGRGTGGLAQAAIGQAATDAFASQFGQERGRQLAAAESLAGLELSRAGGLADILGAQQGRQLSAAGLLGEFGNMERQRQLAAAGALPGIGLLDADILSQIGAQQQAQAQQELTAPITAQQMLLEAGLGSAGLGSPGSTQTTTPLHSNPFASALGGGLAGLQFANLFGGGNKFSPPPGLYLPPGNPTLGPIGLTTGFRIPPGI